MLFLLRCTSSLTYKQHVIDTERKRKTLNIDEMLYLFNIEHKAGNVAIYSV